MSNSFYHTIFVNGATRKFLKIFCTLCLVIVESFISRKWFIALWQKYQNHALVNENFQLIGADLTGGDVHDSKVAIRLLSNGDLILSFEDSNYPISYRYRFTWDKNKNWFAYSDLGGVDYAVSKNMQ